MQNFEQELTNLPKHFIILVVSSSVHYMENNLEILKILLNEKKCQVYILMSAGVMTTFQRS